MKSSRNYATLFLAPPATSAAEAAGRPISTIDCGATAMHRLRHPFAVQAVRATASAEAGHTI
jgi:hypothetical protein